VITTDDVGYPTVRAVVWQRLVDLSHLVVGRDWRRVFTLALGLLVAGAALVALADDQVWDEVGVGFIGGSVVGLVFAIAQHTLDLQSVERQVADEVRLTVSSTGDLEGIDLGGVDLSSVYLWRKRLRYAHMDRARLAGADLRVCDLERASLRQADLRRADLRGSSLEGAVLDGADLTGAELPAGGLTDARLVAAVLVGAQLVRPGDAGVESGAPRRSSGGDSSGDPSRDSGDEAVASPGESGSASGGDPGGQTPESARVDLSGADLGDARLWGASLSGADLRDADLTGADLRGAVAGRADLRGARLVGARLDGVDLTGAIVGGADLRLADLRGAYLTNVDLAATRMDGARVCADDLARAASRPSPSTPGLRIDPLTPPAPDAPGSAGSGGVAVGAGRAGHSDAGTAGRSDGLGALGALAGWFRRRDPGRRRGSGRTGRLVLVAEADLSELAVAVAARLRARWAGLERVNGDLDGIHLHERTPYVGDALDHGLPGSVPVRRRPPRRHSRPWAGLHMATDRGGIELVLHTPGRRPVVLARESVLPGGDTELAGRLASSVQAALADPEVFADAAEIAAFADWLERPDAPIRDALGEVLDRHPRNPVALVARAFSRESSDTHDMTRASDEARVAWAASRSGLVRALAATRLAWAQAQVLHRAFDSEPVLARSRSAADAALGLFDRLDGGRRPSPRLLALRMKAENAWAFSRHVTEQPDDLQAGIARYRQCVRVLERRGLAVSPRTRNSLAYCLMAAVGRFTPGPGAGYAEAIHQLRRLLAHYRVREEGDAIDDTDRRTTISVRTMAHRSAAGQGPPGDLLLRERSLRVGLANLGNLHRLEKDFTAALDCYGAAVYCDPGYVEAYAERAWVHLERADWAAADADIRRGLACDVGTPQQKARILIGYVDALERVGLEAEQGPWLEEARRRDPGNPRVGELQRQWNERFDDRH
jgi:uncharacterized protein YjbI with pentapeptide repeats/tetratricopeptide (TPR) repeat protein